MTINKYSKISKFSFVFILTISLLGSLVPLEVFFDFSKVPSVSLEKKEARAAPPDGRILYSSSGAATTPQTRVYTNGAPGSFSAASTLPVQTAGASTQFIIRAAPTRNEYIAGVLDNNAGGGSNLDIYRFDGTGWTRDWTVTTANNVVGNSKSFDIAYEMSSGRAVVVFSNNTANPQYRIWDGAAWSAAQSVPVVRTTGTAVEMVLATKEGANQIALAYIDTNSDLNTKIWRPASATDIATTSWLAEPTALLEGAIASTVTHKAFDIAFERSSGDVNVFWLRAAAGGVFSAFVTATDISTAGNTVAWTTNAATGGVGGLVELDAEADPLSTSNNIAVCARGGGAGVQCTTWTGAGFSNTSANLDNTLTAPAAEAQGIGVGWSGSQVAVVIFINKGSAVIDYRTSTNGGVWSGALSFTPSPAMAGDLATVRVVTSPISTNQKVMALIRDKNFAMFAKTFDGTTWRNDDGGSLGTTTSGGTPSDFAWDRFVPPLGPDATDYTNGTETTLNWANCPTCGARVSQAGDQTVTVTGTNFGTVAAGSRSTATNNVKIGTFQIPDANVSAWATGSITFILPTTVNVYGGTGASGLTITAGGTADSTSLDFFVFPRITDTDIADGTVAGGQPGVLNSQIGDIITIKGYSFGTGGNIQFTTGTIQTATQIATAGPCGGSAYTDTCVRVRIPGQTGSSSQNIRVTRTTPADSKTSNLAFTIGGPIITTAFPVSGTIGATLNVDIYGDIGNVGIDTDGVNRPTVCLTTTADCTGAISGAFVSVVTAYEKVTYSFNLTGATAGAKNIRLTNFDGLTGTCGSCFTVNSPGPGVTGINPTSGFNDAAITGVSITGSDFDANSIISPSPYLLFGAASIIGTSCTLFSVASLTDCSFNLTQANLGAADSQAWDVKVINANGTGTCGGCFTINNVTPKTPTLLKQFTSGGVLEILPPGEDGQGTNLQFQMQMAGGKTSINYFPEIEIKPLGTVFDCLNTSPHPCSIPNGGVYAEGPGVNWLSGTATGTIDVSTLSSNQRYHWQARVRNAAAANNLSNWVSYPDPTPNSETLEADFYSGTRPSRTVEYFIGQTGVDLTVAASSEFTINLPESNLFIRSAKIELHFKPTSSTAPEFEIRRGAGAVGVSPGNVYSVAAGNQIETVIYDAIDPNLCANCQTMLDIAPGGATYVFFVNPKGTLSDFSAKLVLTYAYTDSPGTSQKTIKYLIHQATTVSSSAEILSSTKSVTIAESSPIFRSTFLEITGVSDAAAAGIQTVRVNFASGTTVDCVSAGSDYAMPIGSSLSQFRILYNISPATLITGNYSFCARGTESGGASASKFSFWNAKLFSTYDASTTGSQTKTQEFFVTQETATLTDGSILNAGNGREFQVSIGDAGTITARSAWIEFTGGLLSITATGSADINAFLTGTSPEPSFEGRAIDFGAASALLPFNVTHDMLSLITGLPGIKNIVTKFRPTGFDAGLLIGRAFVTHSVAAAGGGLSPVGEVISSTFDTTLINGGAIESIMWKSDTTQPAGTVVRFQIASSNADSGWTQTGCGTANNPPPEGCFAGPDGTPSSWYSGDTTYVNYLLNIPKDTPVKIRESHHKNRRYFRYKIQLCSNSDNLCNTAGVNATLTPTVEDIIINWSK